MQNLTVCILELSTPSITHQDLNLDLYLSALLFLFFFFYLQSCMVFKNHTALQSYRS